MPKHLNERKVAGAGTLSPPELRQNSQTSNGVLRDMPQGGTALQRLHCFDTDDVINCAHIVPNAEAVRERARRGAFPADTIREVRTVIDPTTGE